MRRGLNRLRDIVNLGDLLAIVIDILILINSKAEMVQAIYELESLSRLKKLTLVQAKSQVFT